MNSLIALAASIEFLDLGSSASLDDEPEEDEDLDDGDEGVEAAPKAVKKKVKKGGKKMKKGGVEKKASTKTDGGGKADKNVVRLKDLAKQAKLTEAVCRKKLRDADVPRGEGRWSWDLGSKALKAARKALGLSVN